MPGQYEKQTDHQKAREAWKEEKNRRLRQRRIRLLVIVLVAVLVLVLGTKGCQAIRSAGNTPSNDTAVTETKEKNTTQTASQSTKDVEIPAGSSVADISKILKQEGIIKNASIFKYYVRFKGADKDFKAGIYSMGASMSYGDIIKTLQDGAGIEPGAKRVQIPEGYTVDQIAEAVAEASSVSKEDFIKTVKDKAFISRMVEQYPDMLKTSANSNSVRYVFEGYLFPATYYFNEDKGAEDLIEQMLKKTSTVLEKYKGDIEKSDYTIQEIMTLASLVEKEGNTTDDRKKIASTFYNRLKADMAIQSDISVLYALGTHKEMVTFKDLEVDSPYNLYKNRGLGPGPFNSPSEDAIMAAMEPADTDYIYFYANLKNGQVFFTKDYDQHLAWQKEYETTGDIKS